MSNVYPMRVYYGTNGSDRTIPTVSSLPVIQPNAQGLLILDRQVGDQHPGMYMAIGGRWRFVLELRVLDISAVEKTPLVVYSYLTAPVTVPVGSIVYVNAYRYEGLTLEPGGIRVYCVRLPSEVNPSDDPDVRTFIAGANVSGHRVVQLIGQSAYVLSSSDVDACSAGIGITEGAASAGGSVKVRVGGIIQEPSWNMVAGKPVFCGVNGLITQTPPESGFNLVVGVATASDSIYVGVKQPYILSN